MKRNKRHWLKYPAICYSEKKHLVCKSIKLAQFVIWENIGTTVAIAAAFLAFGYLMGWVSGTVTMAGILERWTWENFWSCWTPGPGRGWY